MKLALKVDVDTLAGTLDGVPRLVELLRRNAAQATFLFSLGPDHTGRALKRVFRAGFLAKVQRTSVVAHYGLRTLLYGTLLPGPDIGLRGAPVMQAVRDAGFEVGIHCWDHVKWQDGVATAPAAWTRREFDLARRRFVEVFDVPPRVHGAAGWQMNAEALRGLQLAGFALASDCRGSCPFLPVWDGELLGTPQYPTTLPTIDELVGRDGIDAANVAEHLLAATSQPVPDAQVFTLHAELEGRRFAPAFERLLDGWAQQGWERVSLGELAAGMPARSLPRCRIEWGTVPGRSGRLLVQGAPFPGLANPVESAGAADPASRSDVSQAGIHRFPPGRPAAPVD